MTSFLSGVSLAYVLSVKFVFKHRRLHDRRAEFMGFAALGAAGLAVNAAVMVIAVKYLGLYYLIAKCVAAAFTVICNFVSRRQLLFVLRSTA
jgi:putative flippase GtrA